MKRVLRAIVAGAVLAAAAVGGFQVVAAGAGEQRDADDGARAVATFAAGCFWCMEGPFDKLPGVLETVAGYTGGHLENPSYEQVSSGTTGHTEAVQVVYDPAQISYEKLLGVFWRNVDPTTRDRQFCDRGSQYRPGIFFHDEAQRLAAQASLESVRRSKTFDAEIVVELTAAGPFYRAEEYHQDYYLKNPVRYKFYRYNCGRDQRLEQLWGEG